MSWPAREVTIDILLDVAKEAGMEAASCHPDDIMGAMVNALEGAAKTLEVMSNKGHI